MTIIFLGAGKEGRTAIDDLAESEVKEIIVADYDIEKAEDAAEAHENKKTNIIPKKVDANNHEELVNTMKKGDVVASTIGPFYEYGTKILKAAINAGVDFIDICDDPVPMREELNLDEEAKKADITAVVGCGNNPGTGNICAKFGAQKLDKVDEINIRWLHPASSEASSASLKHALDIFSGKVTTYKDGEWLEVSTSSGKQIVEFPEPVGEVEVYHCGHPEPITLPRYIEGVEKVTCKGGATPVWANRELRRFIDYGFTDTEPIDVNGTSVVPREFMEAFLESITGGMSKNLGAKASRVVVKGEKNGKDMCCSYDRIGRDWTAGISISIGVQILARKEMSEKGVFPPEAQIDPEKFLKEMGKRGLKVKEKIVKKGNAV